MLIFVLPCIQLVAYLFIIDSFIVYRPYLRASFFGDQRVAAPVV